MEVHNSVSVNIFFAFDVWSISVIFDRVNLVIQIFSYQKFFFTLQYVLSPKLLNYITDQVLNLEI